MHEPLAFTEQNLRQLVNEGYRFLAIDEKERIVYALKKPLTSGSLASLEWQQCLLESDTTVSLLQHDVAYQLHVISNTGSGDQI